MLDSAFLFSYAIAMFASGFVAERVSLRYFLSMGMILTGVFTYMFGIARTSNIHSLWYFVIVQIFAGIFQTTGWPGVVALVGRWFGKSLYEARNRKPAPRARVKPADVTADKVYLPRIGQLKYPKANV